MHCFERMITRWFFLLFLHLQNALFGFDAFVLLNFAGVSCFSLAKASDERPVLLSLQGPASRHLLGLVGGWVHLGFRMFW